MAPRYGQLVIGPPGSGKTTYCTGLYEYLSGTGRKAAVINLDPANDHLPYSCVADISELISLPDVMNELGLGPNGGLVYCMEYLEKNIDWLQGKMKNMEDYYYIFDCPGQVELFTHHNSLKCIASLLCKDNFRLVSVNLVDAFYCADAARFVSVLLTSLTTMMQMELPHINILSKVDLIEKYGKLSFSLDYFTDVLDLKYLLDTITEDPFFARHKKLNEKICGLVEDYGLVSFIPLDIESKKSIQNVVAMADKSNGYCFKSVQAEGSLHGYMTSAYGNCDFDFDYLRDVQEKFMDTSDHEVNERPMDDTSAVVE